VVIAVDPSASEKAGHDECGIVALGIDHRTPCHGYVLGDYSCAVAPDVWARRVADAYHQLGANFVLEETQRGGALTSTVIRLIDPTIPIRNRAAVGSKQSRAEPVALLSEQGRLHFVGSLPGLEDECCGWDPLKSPKSPNRIDALTIAACELMLKGPPLTTVSRPGQPRRSERDFVGTHASDWLRG
jgi:phage terminase large subunit-like protein